MLTFLIQRLCLAVATVATVSLVAFVGFGRSLDPTYPLILGGPNSPQRVRLQEEYHLKEPILDRYWLWVKQLPSDGFGTTVLARVSPTGNGQDRNIGPPLWRAAWASARLVGAAFIVALVAAVGLGTFSAQRAGTTPDEVLRVLAYVAMSLPAFLIATLLQIWLYGTSMPHWLVHWALPIAAVACALVGVYARYLRSALLVTLRQPVSIVARGKGASETRVLFRHALRTSLGPLVAVAALEAGAVVGVSLAADFAFGVGGLASLLVYALGRADPFALTAIVVVLSGIVVTFMLIGDLLNVFLDPRVREG